MQALGDAATSKGRRAELARRCGVKPQAVNGWLKTGRITKKNLEVAADFLGHGPKFTPTAHRVRDTHPVGYTARPWPFQFIDYDLVAQLRPDEKTLLEGAWLHAARNLGFTLGKAAAA